jgi:hypothetical protein
MIRWQGGVSIPCWPDTSCVSSIWSHYQTHSVWVLYDHMRHILCELCMITWPVTSCVCSIWSHDQTHPVWVLYDHMTRSIHPLLTSHILCEFYMITWPDTSCVCSIWSHDQSHPVCVLYDHMTRHILCVFYMITWQGVTIPCWPVTSCVSSILAKISNAPLLHLENFKTVWEFTINWYWYHLRFTQLNCQGLKNCNQICNYSTVTVIVEKHVERFLPVLWVHLLKIKYPHVL